MERKEKVIQKIVGTELEGYIPLVEKASNIEELEAAANQVMEASKKHFSLSVRNSYFSIYFNIAGLFPKENARPSINQQPEKPRYTIGTHYARAQAMKIFG